MHIDRPVKKYKDHSHTSYLLIESYRDKNGKPRKRTLLNLNKVPKDLALLIETYIKNKKSISFSDKSIFKHVLGKSYGALKVIFEVMKRLGIAKALGKTEDGLFSMLMIAGIILSPKKSKNYIANFWSKNQAVSEIFHIREGLNENNLYKALDFLSKKQDRIEGKVRASIVKKTNSNRLNDR